MPSCIIDEKSHARSPEERKKEEMSIDHNLLYTSSANGSYPLHTPSSDNESVKDPQLYEEEEERNPYRFNDDAVQLCDLPTDQQQLYEIQSFQTSKGDRSGVMKASQGSSAQVHSIKSSAVSKHTLAQRQSQNSRNSGINNRPKTHAKQQIVEVLDAGDTPSSMILSSKVSGSLIQKSSSP